MGPLPILCICICVTIYTVQNFDVDANADIRCEQSFMVTASLTDRMGVEHILPVRRAVTIVTIIKLDGDRVGECDGVGTCKQALKPFI